MSLVLNYYGRKGKYERHLEHCSGVTGIFCNFDTQHLVTFEDNLQYKGNSHLLAYCHFEITVLTVLAQTLKVQKVLPYVM